MEDFKRYCGKAHEQMLILLWVTQRLKSRQDDENSDVAHAVSAIEQDFIEWGLEFRQRIDFRFDKGDGLLILASPLIVGGVESIRRIDVEHDRDNIINYLDNQLDDFLRPMINIATTLEPYHGEPRPSNWTLVRRLRNSLSHFRYEYDPDSGDIRFEDFNNQGAQTMNLTIPLISVLDLAYRFGRESVGWAQRNGHY